MSKETLIKEEVFKISFDKETVEIFRDIRELLCDIRSGVEEVEEAIKNINR